MGRFMEAMVVCKKGVKAHPSDAAARVLLARVYAEQGKDRKALEELQAALEGRPQDAAANRMAGLLHMKLGEKEQGALALQKAAAAAPGDPETLEALKKWGVAPPAAPPARGPARPQAQGAPMTPRVAPPIVKAPPATPPPASRQAVVARAAEAAPAIAPLPAARAPESAPAQEAPERDLDYARELAEKYSTQEFRLSTGRTGEIPLGGRRKGPGLKATLLLAVLLVAALFGWWAYTSWRKGRDAEIAKLLKDAGELIAKDSYASYKQAARLCEPRTNDKEPRGVLDLDADSLAGHAFLAYVDTLRWGELGDGDALREEAKKQLDAAKRRGERHSHLIAAEAYLQFYGGDAKGSIQTLERILKGPEGGTSGLLYGALGVVQMQSGDLDAAKESLTTARKFADRDVRVNQMLAEQYRRRGSGSEMQAKLFYDAALRLNPDHVPSLIGASMVYVEEGQYDTAMRGVQKVLESRDASNRQLALARVIKGSILYAKGRAAEGADEERQALELDRANPDIQDLIGRRRLRDGDVAGAIESVRRAVEMDPQRVAFYVDLAAAMMKKEGGTKQAVEALRSASEHLPGNARLVKLLGDAYRSDGDSERARVEYERAISIEKRYPDARVALARTWRDRKEWAKALDELDRAIKEYGEGTAGGAGSAWVEKAEIEEARGGSRDAVRDQYERAIRADARNCRALWWLGRDRSDPAGPKQNAELARQMFSDYARLCPREPHAAEAARLAASPAAAAVPVRPSRSGHRR